MAGSIVVAVSRASRGTPIAAALTVAALTTGLLTTGLLTDRVERWEASGVANTGIAVTMAGELTVVFAVLPAAGGSVSSVGANRDDRVSTTFPGVAVGLNSRVGKSSITGRVVSLCMALTIRLHGEL